MMNVWNIFVPYFLILKDFMRFIRKREIYYIFSL